MLSIFPELLSYGLLGPFVMRVALGVFFIVTGIAHSRQKELFKTTWPTWSKPWIYVGGLVEVLLGLLFIIGLYTQVAALIGAVYALKVLFFKAQGLRFATWAPHNVWLYIFILAASLSLLVLGAGLFAFDLPL